MTDLIRTKDILDKYPVSLSTIERLVKQGHLRYYRLAGNGHTRYYDPADVEALFVPSDAEQMEA
jgi:excisionase family DNA binding protein